MRVMRGCRIPIYLLRLISDNLFLNMLSWHYHFEYTRKSSMTIYNSSGEDSQETGCQCQSFSCFCDVGDWFPLDNRRRPNNWVRVKVDVENKWLTDWMCKCVLFVFSVSTALKQFPTVPILSPTILDSPLFIWLFLVSFICLSFLLFSAYLTNIFCFFFHPLKSVLLRAQSVSSTFI